MLATKNAGARGGLTSVILLCLALVSGCAPSGSKALLEGKRQFDAGNLPAAVVQFQKAVELIPTNAVAWSYLGLAQHKSGKFEEGRKAYQTALDRNPNLVEVRYNLGCLLLDAGQPAEAVPMLASFTVFQPGSLTGWQRLALAQMRSRQWDAAEKSAQQILRLSPGNAEAINHLGLIAVQRRRFADAAGLFTSALQSQPGYRPALLNLAVVSHQYLNRKPAALQRYREYLALDTASPVHKEVLATLQHLEAELSAPARPNPLTVAATNAIHALTNTMAATSPALRSNPPPAAAHTPAATQKVAVVTNTPSKPSPPTTATAAAQPPSQGGSVAAPAASAPATGTAVSEPKPPAPSAAAASTGGAPVVPGVQKPVVVTKPTEPAKAPEPKPEPEIVKVVESEPIVAAPAAPVRETVPPPATSAPPVPAVAETAPATATAGAAKPATSPTGGEEEEIGSAPDRQGLLGRINPKNWFKGRERTPTPLGKGGPARSETSPAGIASAPATPPASTAPTPAPAVAAVKPPVTPAAPVPVVVPQYVYRNPSPRPGGDRDAAQKWVLRGLQEQKERRLKEAMASFETAAKTDPTCFEAHYNLGVAALDGGEVGVALSAYEEALALNGTSLPARFNFSLALERGGYFKDAAAQMEKAVQLSPADARLRYAVGVLYAQRLGQKDLARAHYQKLLEIEPNHPQAVNIRYWLAANR